jgi:hypothetical protein
MDTSDAWTRQMLNNFRAAVARHRIHEWNILYPQWLTLAKEFRDEIEILTNSKTRHKKLQKFLILNNTLAEFILSWKDEHAAELQNLCAGMRKILADGDGWRTASEEVVQTLKFVAGMCNLKTKGTVFRMPLSLRTLLSDSAEADNVKNHAEVLQQLKRMQAPNCGEASRLQALVADGIAKFQNEVDKENSFGLYTLKKLANGLFQQRVVLGQENVEGVAVKASMDVSGNPQVVLKTANALTRDNNNILHEFVIGSVMNRIRCNTPGFMYVLGGFFCSGFELGIENLCNVQDNDSALTTIIISEFIAGKPLSAFANDARLPMILEQLQASLKIAQALFKFCHNDLHCENVLVKVLPAPQKISYIDPDTKAVTRLDTDVIPVIIDYGKARLAFNEVQIFPVFVDGFVKTKDLIEDSREKFYPSFDWLRLLTTLSCGMKEPWILKKYVTESQLASPVIQQWFHSLDSGKPLRLKASSFNSQTESSCVGEF